MTTACLESARLIIPALEAVSDACVIFTAHVNADNVMPLHAFDTYRIASRCCMEFRC
jgi:hypothetical protein